MYATTSRLLGVAALLAVSAACVGADWNQAFKQTATQTTAQPEPTAPDARTRAVRRPPTAVIAAQTPAAQTAAAQTAAADIARGEEHYRRGEIADAARVFETRALAAGTPAEQSSTLFRVGVQWHNEVLKAPAEQKVAIRNAAVRAYQKSLQINPRSGPALNNLAQLIKSDPAKSTEADALLARAVALSDSHKGVYLMNRAELKRDAGDLKAASTFAMQAAADDKGNEPAHQLVMNILVTRQDADALLEYIRDLNERGLVVRALDSAVDGMTRVPGARKRLLISMAVTLGNAAYTADPWQFENTEAGQALAKFAGDPSIGPGVNEMFRVLRTPSPASTLTWWREGFDGFMEPMKNTPAAAMQNLTRRCGEIYRAAGDNRAEGYYRMSVAISGKVSTDPRALLGLSEILYEQKRLDELNKVLQENEPGLMEAKRYTIAAADDLHTYQLRVALGMMYGYVERWVNPSQYYAASIWMLENAQGSAKEYNRKSNLPPSRQVKLPPNAVKMLSTGYAKTDKLQRSVETRLQFAELYLKSDQKKFAQLVLDAEWQRSLPDSLDAGLKLRLADLTSKASG